MYNTTCSRPRSVFVSRCFLDNDPFLLLGLNYSTMDRNMRLQRYLDTLLHYIR